MRDLIDRGILARLEAVYRRSSLSKHEIRSIVVKPVARGLIRAAERLSSFDTSPVRPLPQRLAMLTGSADKQVIRMASLFLAPPCVFWDVGANIGYITRRLVKASRNTATACAFEPNPELFEVLTRNLAPLRSVRLMPCALGAADGEMTLFVGEYCVMASASKAWTVSSGTPVSSIREYVVPVRSGDSLIRAGEAPAPGLLKIDVEGYEMAVLEGLRDHLAAVRDMAVICEFSPPAMEKAGYQPTDIFRKLWELNFRVWHMEDPGRMSAISTVDEARRFQEHVGGNYVNMFAVKGHARLVSHW